MSIKMQNIILAAGGTGGHIFPAHAVAEELKRKDYNPILVTDKKYYKYASSNNIFKIEAIESATPYKRGIHRLIAYISILFGVIQSMLLIIKYKPLLIIGFGGYPAFPILFAAKLFNIKIIIHEQNSAIGRANKYFAKYAAIIATSFKNTIGLSETEKNKSIFIGNPVRKSIFDISYEKYPIITDKINILIIGGSQAASIFSKIIPNALASIPNDLKNKIKITQQCRKEDIDFVKSIYTDADIEFELNYFFKDMDVKLKESHLVVTRAGASTIAELIIAKRPALIVPIPYSFENHQMHNAKSFIENNKGWIMIQDDFTIQNFANEITKFINTPSLLSDAAANFTDNYNCAAKKLLELIENNIKQ